MKKKQIKESVLAARYSHDKTQLTESLENARPSDLSKTPADTKGGIMKTAFRGGIRYMIIIACSLVFVSTCVYLLIYTIQYFQKQEENRFLSEFMGNTDYVLASVAEKDTQNVRTVSVGDAMNGVVIGNTSVEKREWNEEYEKMRSKLIGLQRLYPNVWGWIEIKKMEGLDYVIMRSKDNNDYLYTGIDGKYNRNGSIFTDKRTYMHLEDNRNLVIYGHNMNTTGAMFYPLLEYATNEEAFNNWQINISTVDGIYTYSVFSVYDTSVKFNYIKTYFSSDEDYLSFLQTIERKSVFHKDIELTADLKILTLSTCTVRQDNRRWAIHAYLVGISK